MRFQCHSCGFQTEAPDRYAGKSVKCPKCKTPVTIVAQGTPPPANHGYSVSEFLKKTRFSQKQGHGFELEKDRLLQVKLNGRVWTKLGAMVAYEGQMTFTREGIFEHGVGKMFKKAATGEGAQLMKAEGMGYLYLADNGKKISIPSAAVNVGDEIKPADRDEIKNSVKESVEVSRWREVPSWLSLDEQGLVGRVVELPRREELLVPIKEQLIVELCSR